MRSISVETSQNVQITIELASLGQRIGAFLIDFFLVYLVLILSTVALFLALGVDLQRTEFGFVLVGFYLVMAFYHLGMEYFFDGQSLGKKMLGIQVVRIDGDEAGFFHYFMRWMFRLIDITLSTGVVAIIAIALTDKQQRIGDILAGTTVVRVRTAVASKRFHGISSVASEQSVTFSQVSLLTDADVRKISGVIHKISTGDHDYYTRSKLMIQLKSATMKKLGITQTDLESDTFIEQILQDYRNYHRRGPTSGG